MTVTDITNFISGALPENTVFSLNLVLRKTSGPGKLYMTNRMKLKIKKCFLKKTYPLLKGIKRQGQSMATRFVVMKSDYAEFPCDSTARYDFKSLGYEVVMTF